MRLIHFIIFNFSGYLMKKYNIELENHYCVPDTCSEGELDALFEHYLSDGSVKVQWLQCMYKQRLNLQAYDYFVM